MCWDPGGGSELLEDLGRVPLEPLACDYELLSTNHGLLWGLVIGLLGDLAFEVVSPKGLTTQL